MAKDPEFLILKSPVGWLPESDCENILGAAVKNHWSPTSDSVPEKPLFYNNAGLVETQFEDFILRNDDVSSSSHELTVKGLGKLRWSKKADSKLDLKGKVIYIKRLKRIGEFWKDILKDEEFQETVVEWVGEKKRFGRAKYQVCLVVGLLMCQDIDVATSAEDARDRQARNEVPLGTIAERVAASHGVPLSTGGIGNAAIDNSKSIVNRMYFEAAGKGKKVFALELRIISMKEGRLKMTDKTPKAPANRQLGDGDGDGGEEVDPDDLIVKDLDEQDWNELLEDQPN